MTTRAKPERAAIYVHDKCGNELVRKPGMFAWRGAVFHDLVCEQCKALWSDPADSFNAAVGLPERMPGVSVRDEVPR